jgi:hypothetical protein
MSVTIQSLGGFDPANPGAIGGTTPAAGGFTTVTADGLKFPAAAVDSANANTLDDYEEGTWTPTLTFATPGNLVVAYSTQAGTYTKIGRVVVLNYQTITSTFTHSTASGNFLLGALPFTPNASIAEVGTLAYAGITKATYTSFNTLAPFSGTTLSVFASGSGVAGVNLTTADIPTGTQKVIDGTISFHV